MSLVIKTNAGRIKRLQRYKNLITNLPHIAQIAVGDGGREVDDTLKTPTSDRTTLYNEILRKDVSFENVDDYSTKVLVFLDSAVDTILEGKDINEMAIIDSEGTLITLETFNLFDIATGFPSNTQTTIKTQITME